MLFNSLSFGIFLVVALGGYHLVVGWTGRKTVLLLMSYAFYAAWNPLFLGLLVFSTLVDWFASGLIHRSTVASRRRAYLIASLAINVGLLGTFKYYTFFAHNLGSLAAAMGLDLKLMRLSLVLPVGISFYTFQTISYTIDVYRRKLVPTRSLLDYALYVTFFPQLVAGPIVRATEFLPQCESPKPWRLDQIGWGLQLFLFGLFQKVVLADRVLGPISDVAFAAPDMDFLTAWLGTIAFAGQIYSDFAGYSTCAIGVALCFGFYLPQNFRYPFAAIGIADLWGRWHVSLSTWLRDYVYVSLGGTRASQVRTSVNLFATMLLGGLWHGAAWTFVLWGALHAAYLTVEHQLARSRIATWRIWSRAPGEALLMGLTFLLFSYSMAFFRGTSLPSALAMARAMWAPWTPAAEVLNRWHVVIVAVTMTLIVGYHWSMRDRSVASWVARCPAVVLVALDVAMIVAIVLVPGSDRAFVYFQF